MSPSGSGKSKLLRTLNLLEERTEGRVSFAATDVPDVRTTSTARASDEGRIRRGRRPRARPRGAGAPANAPVPAAHVL
ncbi:MAG TPA: hypothetical protein VN213_04025 [Solirubrobacteraceae bacterium]|nr:hypothetical protein [Solirubrobacteraceae bacterium]